MGIPIVYSIYMHERHLAHRTNDMLLGIFR